MRILPTASKAGQRLSQPYQQLASGTGAQTVYWLEKTPTVPGGLLVFVAGAVKAQKTAAAANDYSVDGNKVTFVVAPPAGTNNILFFVVSV